MAATFVVAAVLKLRDRRGTTDDFASLGLPRPATLAALVPLAELAVALMLVVAPGWGAVAAFVLLAAFTTVLIGVIRAGRVVSCACFGGGNSEPVDIGHVVRNAVLMVWALPVLGVDRIARPSGTETVVGLALIIGPAAVLAWWRARRRSG
ncbi:MAG: MauE/DoxX family redox-associated membrane protein [Acidimicrobiales bacterium]